MFSCFTQLGSRGGAAAENMIAIFALIATFGIASTAHSASPAGGSDGKPAITGAYQVAQTQLTPQQRERLRRQRLRRQRQRGTNAGGRRVQGRPATNQLRRPGNTNRPPPARPPRRVQRPPATNQFRRPRNTNRTPPARPPRRVQRPPATNQFRRPRSTNRTPSARPPRRVQRPPATNQVRRPGNTNRLPVVRRPRGIAPNNANRPRVGTSAWRNNLRTRRSQWVQNRNRADWRRLRSVRRAQRRSNRRARRIFRRNRFQIVRRRQILNRWGRLRYINSRRYWVRDRRYYNRFRGGYSIYFLPPVAVGIAAGAYYLSAERASYTDYVNTFIAPPVRPISRRYTMDEIVADPEIRSAVRSVNLNVISFPSGSDQVPDHEIDKLNDLADAIRATLADRPKEVFLIEGHTDAVGSDEANLDLSERRAATVQEILVAEYGIPAENLESVGYGEQYLQIDTDGPEERNRRVVIRAVGALLAERAR